jgi:asparagine synthase (glutamine-hydrolysing)
LGLFAGFPAAFHADGGIAAAFLPSPRLKAPIRGWRPHRSASGATVLLHGRIHNRSQLETQLNPADGSDAALYAAAVERWGDAADYHVIGEYCSIIAGPDRLRLARSPWSAPPLCFCHFDGQSVAASVPRVLHAAGLPVVLDQTRMADNLYFNLLDRRRGWFEGVHRVAGGTVVTLDRTGTSREVVFYDPRDLPKVRLPRDEDYVAAAQELLDEAAAKALEGARCPGIMLSGGLDSPLLAASVLAQLPAGQRLPSFTFAPLDAWNQRLAPGWMGDERPFVRAFAAMHPALDAHFTQNPDTQFDARWSDLFTAMGGAPNHLCNFYVYHGVWAGAREAGCDLLLTADFGNQTYSNEARWGYVEYLLGLRWRQLRLALRDRPGDDRSIWHKLAALSLLRVLPAPLRRIVRNWRHGSRGNLNRLISVLPDAAEAEAAARARTGGAMVERELFARQVDSVAFEYAWRDCEAAEVQQGFEQVYGIRQIDVPAYRPLAEFCAGLPTDQFLRNGTSRWLARRMAVGRLPEAQRNNTAVGWHNVDWHERMTPRLTELRQQAEAIAGNPALAGLIDPAKLLEVIDNWPAEPSFEAEGWVAQSAGLPRGLLAARFVAHVSGRNSL